MQSCNARAALRRSASLTHTDHAPLMLFSGASSHTPAPPSAHLYIRAHHQKRRVEPSRTPSASFCGERQCCAHALWPAPAPARPSDVESLRAATLDLRTWIPTETRRRRVCVVAIESAEAGSCSHRTFCLHRSSSRILSRSLAVASFSMEV